LPTIFHSREKIPQAANWYIKKSPEAPPLVAVYVIEDINYILHYISWKQFVYAQNGTTPVWPKTAWHSTLLWRNL